jgi:branched-subunit amino acid ABC-type transport system permease component
VPDERSGRRGVRSSQGSRSTGSTIRRFAGPISASDGLSMRELLEQVFSGASNGAIYASLALALVMIYRSTEVVNFAQGAMATFSTYVAWMLVEVGFPFWAAFIVTLTVSFLGGLAIERIIIRRVESGPVLAAVVVTIGLLLILNSLAGWLFSYTVREFPGPPRFGLRHHRQGRGGILRHDQCGRRDQRP